MYSTLHGPVTLAVPYVVSDQQIMIPLGSFNDTGWLAAGGEATLEITGVGIGLTSWLVRATGTALRSDLLDTMNLPLARHCHPSVGSGWPQDGSTQWLVLPQVRVRGYYETSAIAMPAAGERDAHDIAR